MPNLNEMLALAAESQESLAEKLVRARQEGQDFVTESGKRAEDTLEGIEHAASKPSPTSTALVRTITSSSNIVAKIQVQEQDSSDRLYKLLKDQFAIQNIYNQKLLERLQDMEDGGGAFSDLLSGLLGAGAGLLGSRFLRRSGRGAARGVGRGVGRGALGAAGAAAGAGMGGRFFKGASAGARTVPAVLRKTIFGKIGAIVTASVAGALAAAGITKALAADDSQPDEADPIDDLVTEAVGPSDADVFLAAAARSTVKKTVKKGALKAADRIDRRSGRHPDARPSAPGRPERVRPTSAVYAGRHPESFDIQERKILSPIASGRGTSPGRPVVAPITEEPVRTFASTTARLDRHPEAKPFTPDKPEAVRTIAAVKLDRHPASFDIQERRTPAIASGRGTSPGRPVVAPITAQPVASGRGTSPGRPVTNIEKATTARFTLADRIPAAYDIEDVKKPAPKPIASGRGTSPGRPVVAQPKATSAISLAAIKKTAGITTKAAKGLGAGALRTSSIALRVLGGPVSAILQGLFASRELGAGTHEGHYRPMILDVVRSVIDEDGLRPTAFASNQKPSALYQDLASQVQSIIDEAGDYVDTFSDKTILELVKPDIWKQIVEDQVSNLNPRQLFRLLQKSGSGYRPLASVWLRAQQLQHLPGMKDQAQRMIKTAFAASIPATTLDYIAKTQIERIVVPGATASEMPMTVDLPSLQPTSQPTSQSTSQSTSQPEAKTASGIVSTVASGRGLSPGRPATEYTMEEFDEGEQWDKRVEPWQITPVRPLRQQAVVPPSKPKPAAPGRLERHAKGVQYLDDGYDWSDADAEQWDYREERPDEVWGIRADVPAPQVEMVLKDPGAEQWDERVYPWQISQHRVPLVRPEYKHQPLPARHPDVTADTWGATSPIVMQVRAHAEADKKTEALAKKQAEERQIEIARREAITQRGVSADMSLAQPTSLADKTLAAIGVWTPPVYAAHPVDDFAVSGATIADWKVAEEARKEEERQLKLRAYMSARRTERHRSEELRDGAMMHGIPATPQLSARAQQRRWEEQIEESRRIAEEKRRHESMLPGGLPLAGGLSGTPSIQSLPMAGLGGASYEDSEFYKQEVLPQRQEEERKRIVQATQAYTARLAREEKFTAETPMMHGIPATPQLSARAQQRRWEEQVAESRRIAEEKRRHESMLPGGLPLAGGLSGAPSIQSLPMSGLGGMAYEDSEFYKQEVLPQRREQEREQARLRMLAYTEKLARDEKFSAEAPMMYGIPSYINFDKGMMSDIPSDISSYSWQGTPMMSGIQYIPQQVSAGFAERRRKQRSERHRQIAEEKRRHESMLPGGLPLAGGLSGTPSIQSLPMAGLGGASYEDSEFYKQEILPQQREQEKDRADLGMRTYVERLAREEKFSATEPMMYGIPATPQLSARAAARRWEEQAAEIKRRTEEKRRHESMLPAGLPLSGGLSGTPSIQSLPMSGLGGMTYEDSEFYKQAEEREQARQKMLAYTEKLARDEKFSATEPMKGLPPMSGSLLQQTRDVAEHAAAVALEKTKGWFSSLLVSGFDSDMPGTPMQAGLPSMSQMKYDAIKNRADVVIDKYKKRDARIRSRGYYADIPMMQADTPPLESIPSYSWQETPMMSGIPSMRGTMLQRGAGTAGRLAEDAKSWGARIAQSVMEDAKAITDEKVSKLEGVKSWGMRTAQSVMTDAKAWGARIHPWQVQQDVPIKGTFEVSPNAATKTDVMQKIERPKPIRARPSPHEAETTAPAIPQAPTPGVRSQRSAQAAPVPSNIQNLRLLWTLTEGQDRDMDDMLEG